MPDDLDDTWKALSDPTRRAILDLLRDGPAATAEIVSQFPGLSRFGVMKHLDVLRTANLVLTHKDGRKVVNRLNVVPIRMIYTRWVKPYEDLWSRALLGIKDIAEDKA